MRASAGAGWSLDVTYSDVPCPRCGVKAIQLGQDGEPLGCLVCSMEKSAGDLRLAFSLAVIERNRLSDLLRRAAKPIKS